MMNPCDIIRDKAEMAWRHRSSNEKTLLKVIAFLVFALTCFIITVTVMDITYKAKIKDLEDQLDQQQSSTTEALTSHTSTLASTLTSLSSTTPPPITTTAAPTTTTTTTLAPTTTPAPSTTPTTAAPPTTPPDDGVRDVPPRVLAAAGGAAVTAAELLWDLLCLGQRRQRADVQGPVQPDARDLRHRRRRPPRAVPPRPDAARPGRRQRHRALREPAGLHRRGRPLRRAAAAAAGPRPGRDHREQRGRSVRRRRRRRLRRPAPHHDLRLQERPGGLVDEGRLGRGRRQDDGASLVLRITLDNIEHITRFALMIPR
nr:uncharacterized protein LOC113806449 isoform X3 [Penaeus vannamei]